MATREERRVGEVAALAAGLGAVTVWASAFVAIRDSVEVYSPGAVALGRLLPAVLILGAIVLVRREPLPPRRALVPIAISGVLWLGVYSVALNAAEERVDAGTAAMIVNTGPLIIAVLAGLFLGEGFPRMVFVGCAVGLAGCALIAVATTGESTVAGWGVALCVLAAFAYSVALVVQKPFMRGVSPLQVTFLACVAAMLALTPFLPQLVRDAGDARGSATLGVVYLGVFPTALGFVLWNFGLKRTHAGRMGALTLLAPPIAVMLSWAFLDEVPRALSIAGGAVCLAGVAFARIRTGRGRPFRRRATLPMA